MFGKNQLLPIIHHADHLSVESIFYTIQGEGPFSGMPALFIRMSGCNLACHFCDTQFETNINRLQSIEEILVEVGQFPESQRSLVVLTGGEPMRQNCHKLISVLLMSGTDCVQIETAGTAWQGEDPDQEAEFEGWLASGEVVLVCSPKTPKVHPKITEHCLHWKYVVAEGEVSEGDGLPNRGTQMVTKDKEQTIYRCGAWRANGDINTVWISPRDDYDANRNLLNRGLARDVCLKHGYRLSLQVHKIIGVE